MIRIQLLNRLNTYPLDMDMYLDTDESTEVRHNTNLQELTDLGAIKLSNIVGTSIPNTAKNELLMLLQPMNTRLPCRVVDENEKPIAEVFWISYTETRIEINFVTYHRQWAEQLQKLSLTKLNFYKNGTLTLNRATIEDNWTKYRWLDNQPPVYLGLIKYRVLHASRYNLEGNPQGIDTVRNSVIIAPNDLRPLISPLFILQEMFTQIGWQFRSPFYESNYGRELWAYHLAKDFVQVDVLGYNYNFKVSLEQDNGTNYPLPIPEWVPLNDSGSLNNDNYDRDTAWVLDTFPQPTGIPTPNAHWRNNLRTTATYSFTATFKGVSHNVAGKAPIKVSIQIFDDSAGTSGNWGDDKLFDQYSLEPVIDQGQSLDIVVKWENAVILPRYRLRLSAKCSDDTLNATVYIDYGTSIEGAISDPTFHYKDEMVFKVRDNLCLDILKGYAHPIKGVFHTDWVNKVVTMYPQKSVVLPSGEVIEGYYLPIAQDIDSYNPKNIKDNISYKKNSVGFTKAQDYRDEAASTNDMNYDADPNPYDTDSDNLNYNNTYFSYINDDVLGRNFNSPSGASVLSSALEADVPNMQEFDVAPFIVKALQPAKFLNIKQTERRIEWFYDYAGNSFDELENIQQFVIGTDYREAIGDIYQNIPMVTQLPMAYKLKREFIKDHFSIAGRAKSLAYIFYAPALKANLSYEVLTADIDSAKIIDESFFRFLIKTQISGKPKLLRGTNIVDFQTKLPVILQMSEILKEVSDYSDSYYIKRVYKQPANPLSSAFLTNIYLGSFKIDGEEQLTNPIKVNETPIEKPIGSVTYLDNWLEVLGIFFKAEPYSAGTNRQLFTYTFPKGIHFSAIFMEGDDFTDYRTHMVRFDPDGVWNNNQYSSGSADNYAYWEKDITYDLRQDTILKIVKD